MELKNGYQDLVNLKIRRVMNFTLILNKFAH